MHADTTHSLKKIVRHYSQRPYVFYDRHAGHLVGASGRTVDVSPNADIRRLCAWVAFEAEPNRARQIWITGGQLASDVPGHDPNDTEAVERYWSAPLLDGWTITSWKRSPWRVSYEKRTELGEQIAVDIGMASAWYGGEHDAKKCLHAHQMLSAMIRSEFDSYARLLGSPGRTGADLLERCLPDGVEYAPLEPRLVQVLGDVDNFTQGRLEQPGLYREPVAPRLVVLDGRWMYASALRHLPSVPASWEKRSPQYDLHRKAVYRIATRVPDHWDHIGLVGYFSRGDGRTVYPRAGGTFIESAWLTGAELEPVYAAGWPVNIHESIKFAPEAGPYTDPARGWVERMLRLRAWALLNNNELVLRAIRAILIHTVGYWHRSATVNTGFVPRGQEYLVPRDARFVLPTPEGTRYTVAAELAQGASVYYQPHWAVQVWGSTRAKLHQLALALPSQRVMWLRHDSIVTDYDPGLKDNGRPGQWRVKWSIDHSVPAPLTETAYRALKAGLDDD